MTPLTPGKIRGLQQLATPGGHLIILALDHRGTLTKMMGIRAGDPGAYTKIRDFKLLVLGCLAPHASAVLLNAETIAGEAVARGALPGHQGLLVTLEESGYAGASTARETRLLAGWSAAKVKRMGASAAKLLVHFNPEAEALAERQERMVAGVIEQARRLDLTLVVEPVTYSADPNAPDGSPEFAAKRPALVAETARRIGALGPDALKLEFPCDARYDRDESSWADACAAIDAASPVPWAMLSGGVDFHTFQRQVRVACQAGACGYVAGRSFWQDAVTLPATEQRTFLETTVIERMVSTAQIAAANACPWTARTGNLIEAAGVGPGWYQEYPEL